MITKFDAIQTNKVNNFHKQTNLISLLLFAILTLGLIINPIVQVNAQSNNLISNPSVETGTTSPIEWYTSKWGINTSTFSYLNNGYDGQKSIYVKVSNYTSGDAKWIFNPVSVASNTTYYFSDYYKSTSKTAIVVRLIDSLNHETYLDLGNEDISTNWKNINLSFKTSANTVKATVFHLIRLNGELWTDKFYLSDQPYISPIIAPTTNIPNPSVETISSSDSQKPQSWNTGGWGINSSVFTYLNTGHTGTRSINVTISSYTNGDAKWFYDDEPVQGGTTYDFVDYYKSNVTTYITLEIINSDNSLSYIDLGSVIASSSWSRAAFEVVLPVNAVKATVFHHLDSVGSLTTDDYIFEPITNYTVVNGVPNNSVEQFSQLNQNTPLGWTSSSWGTNTPIFSYLNTGHTGNHSLKVEMSSYINGDAKWYFDAQSVQGGKDYQFSDWYISDITSKIVVEVTHQDNSLSYLTLGTFSETPIWKQAIGTITMPADAVKATVYHLIDNKGSLITDDFTFTQITQIGLNRPIVSINFDDGWQSIYTNGLPLFDKYGLKTTQYLVSGFLNTPQYLTIAEAQAFINDGHQIGSHSVDHADLTTLTTQQITDELQKSKAFLESTFGIQIKDYAAPYGTYNDNIINIAKTFYRSYRTTDVGMTYKSSYDPYKIKTQNITNTTTLLEVQNWLNEAKTNKTWLVLVYHEVNTSGGEYSTTPTELDKELQAIKNSGIQVETMDQAITEISSQI